MYDESFIDSLDQENFSIVGVDEVGRGPLAGPVIACGVLYSGSLEKYNKFKQYLISLGIKDSKKISAKKRKNILEKLNIKNEELTMNQIIDVGDFSFYLSFREASYIDEHNILKSTMDSMRDICKSLTADLYVIDGDKLPQEEKTKSLTQGESKSILIALASIIAKENRDYFMNFYHQLYPKYNFKKHSGYGTKEHRENIEKHGICPIHRKTFLKNIKF